jgi:alpha-glucoside transport system permease protein
MTDEAGSSAGGEPEALFGSGRAERDTTAAVTQTLAGPAAPLALDADTAASASAGRAVKVKAPRQPGEARSLAVVFLAPALILLAAIMVYPLVYTIVRSLFADGPAATTGDFSWLHQYQKLFTNTDTFRALKNNLIWVIVVPALVTILGLIFAVLSEKVRWKSAFRLVLFMPMAISMLASGVTFGLIYNDQPSRGLANAITIGVHDTFASTSGYPDLHTTGTTVLTGSPKAGYTSVKTYSGTTPVLLPFTGLNLQSPPKSAKPAAPGNASGLNGVVWNDFKLGGGGTKDAIDPGELGLGGVTVHAVQNGKVVASTSTNDNGAFSFPKLTSGDYTLAVPASNFSGAYGGLSWLGPDLITPSIIVAYLWAWAGFAMVLLASGMSAISREALEAARMDGATEFQVFRKVTVPLLAPVLTVVFVTMIINVLKVFDLVFIISQGAGANGKYSNVLATQLYQSYGNQAYGAASAVGVVLVLLVLPAMIINIRRFRREGR